VCECVYKKGDPTTVPAELIRHRQQCDENILFRLSDSFVRNQTRSLNVKISCTSITVYVCMYSCTFVREGERQGIWVKVNE